MSAMSDDAPDERLLASMRAEPAAFGAFYRRHEDQVLGYFLARGGDPEVAADLTAETFAAALASAHRFRPRKTSAAAWLFGIAGNKLAMSRRRGRVEDRARRGLGMAPLVLSEEAVERIAANDRTAPAPLVELPGHQQDDVRARVIEELDDADIAKELRCSEAVVRKRASRGLGDAPSPPGAEAVTRVPELEQELVAAAARPQTHRRPARPAALAAAAVVAAVVVIVVMVTPEDGADRRSRRTVARASQPDANPNTLSTLTPLHETQELERRAVQTANGWARLFASDRDDCRYMSQPACERKNCMRVSSKSPRPRIRGCTPPSAEFRKSFRRASVKKIEIRGRRAAARFTNGEVVELFRPTQVDLWMIHKVGENAGRGFFK